MFLSLFVNFLRCVGYLGLQQWVIIPSGIGVSNINILIDTFNSIIAFIYDVLMVH